MKLNIMFTMICILMFSCDNTTNLLCEKWYVKNIVYTDTTHIVNDCEFYIQFKKDNTYESNGEIFKQGIWSLEKDKLFFDNDLEIKLILLTKDTLLYSMEDENNSTILVTSTNNCIED